MCVSSRFCCTRCLFCSNTAQKAQAEGGSQDSAVGQDTHSSSGCDRSSCERLGKEMHCSSLSVV